MDNATLLHYLKKLKTIMLTRPDRRPEWFEPLNGMCCNFDDMVYRDKIYDEPDMMRIPTIRTALELWPHYTGNTMYCIPNPSVTAAGSTRVYSAAHNIYHTIGNMYDRRKAYCRLRYELLDHLIEHVEAKV